MLQYAIIDRLVIVSMSVLPGTDTSCLWGSEDPEWGLCDLVVVWRPR